MQYSALKRTRSFLCKISICAAASILMVSCGDEVLETSNDSSISFEDAHFNINPYSVTNIRTALGVLDRASEELNADRLYYYYKFDPEKFTGDMLAVLAKDSTCHLMEFPFASMSVYDDQLIANWETAQENLKDGHLYIVFKANSELSAVFSSGSGLNAEKLDELYLPEPADSSLQLQALSSATNISIPELRIRFCFFKQPHGRIRYKDTETSTLYRVPNMRVWALAYGIPVYDRTDHNGRYAIPWLFNAGTLMGIHAANSKMEVVPLNTVGGVFSRIGQVTSNFILGSRKNFGWRSSCQMNNDINVDYKAHNQERYWCHIMHAIKLHYDYTAMDGIPHSPSLMVCYARWDENTGGGSAPMLGHLQNGNKYVDFASLAGVLFGVNLETGAPHLFQLMTRRMPDMTLKVSNDETKYHGDNDHPQNRFSESFMELTFHELSHASLFNQVGSVFWEGIITQIISNSGYGNGTGRFFGLTQVNESWAAFYGKMQHWRHHPNGHTYVKLYNYPSSSWEPYPEALEDVPWFYDDWMNTGIFYDLMDEPTQPEHDDLIHGYTVAQLYYTFNPNTCGFCRWRDDFLNRFPQVNNQDMEDLMKLQNTWNGKCDDSWLKPIFE